MLGVLTEIDRTGDTEEERDTHTDNHEQCGADDRTQNAAAGMGNGCFGAYVVAERRLDLISLASIHLNFVAFAVFNDMQRGREGREKFHVHEGPLRLQDHRRPFHSNMQQDAQCDHDQAEGDQAQKPACEHLMQCPAVLFSRKRIGLGCWMSRHDL